MKPEEIRVHIQAAATSFDAELHTDAYAETHSDAAQLRQLVAFLSPRDDQSFLDLGTGNGYVAMAVAVDYPTCRVVGLDIAQEAIKQDLVNARQQGLKNIDFRLFNGVTLPFEDSYFDGAVSRYAFHHLPQPEATLGEIARTLRRGGKLVLADPIRSQDDVTDFINRFQDLKRDGHAIIFRFRDFVDLVSRQGFELIDWFESSISFGRARNREYDNLLASTPTPVRETYHVRVDGDKIRMTFRILNAVFLSRK